MKQTKDERAKLIEEGITTAWSSLNSHLPLTYGKPAVVQGDCDFHKKAVKEYLAIITILTKLY